MPGKKRGGTRSLPLCAVCKAAESKYRCSSCAVRYCSVGCYKIHKDEQCSGAGPSSSTSTSSRVPPSPNLSANPTPKPECETNANFEPLEHDPIPSVSGQDVDVPVRPGREGDEPLKALTDIAWPPEPDESVFTDPLRREDPKPLRHAELMRIATSPQLRHLLNTTSLPRILRIIDSLPTPNARSAMLSRLLGIDNDSLARPGGGSLLSQRDSPPPLGELLDAAVNGRSVQGQRGDRDNGERGWWLGREGAQEGRIWIGEEETGLMRVWAGVVCGAIDDSGGDAWGKGDLAWEV